MSTSSGLEFSLFSMYVLSTFHCCHGNQSLLQLITEQIPTGKVGRGGECLALWRMQTGIGDTFVWLCLDSLPLLWNSWHLLVHPYSICKELNAFHVLPRSPAAEDDVFPNVPWWEFISCKSTHSVFTSASDKRQHYMFWTMHPTMTISKKEKKHSTGRQVHWRPRIDLWLVLAWSRHNKHCLLAISLLPPKPDPRVVQLARLQWLVLCSVPTPDHALCTVPGLLLLKQTSLVWSVAEPRCRWRHHLSAPLAPCQDLARSSWITPMKKWRPRAA